MYRSSASHQHIPKLLRRLPTCTSELTTACALSEPGRVQDMTAYYDGWRLPGRKKDSQVEKETRSRNDLSAAAMHEGHLQKRGPKGERLFFAGGEIQENYLEARRRAFSGALWRRPSGESDSAVGCRGDSGPALFPRNGWSSSAARQDFRLLGLAGRHRRLFNRLHFSLRTRPHQRCPSTLRLPVCANPVAC